MDTPLGLFALYSLITTVCLWILVAHANRLERRIGKLERQLRHARVTLSTGGERSGCHTHGAQIVFPGEE
jgi:hypothetical protein